MRGSGGWPVRGAAIMLLCVLFLSCPSIATATETVPPIPSTSEGDHSTDAGASDPSARFDIIDLCMGVFVIGGFWFVAQRKWLPIQGSITSLGPTFGATAVLLLLMLFAQPIGAAFMARICGVELAAGDMSFENDTLIHLGSYLGTLPVLIAMVVLMRRVERDEAGDSMSRWRAAALGALAIILVGPLIMLVGDVGAMIHDIIRGETSSPIAHNLLQTLVDRPFDEWTFARIALVVVGAPLIEEVLYRGLVLTVLCRSGIGAWPAIIGTSLLFGIAHWSVAPLHAVIALMVFGVCLGWIHLRTKRLAAPIALHALFNLTNVLLAMLLS